MQRPNRGNGESAKASKRGKRGSERGIFPPQIPQLILFSFLCFFIQHVWLYRKGRKVDCSLLYPSVWTPSDALPSKLFRKPSLVTLVSIDQYLFIFRRSHGMCSHRPLSVGIHHELQPWEPQMGRPRIGSLISSSIAIVSFSPMVTLALFCTPCSTSLDTMYALRSLFNP